MARGMYFGVNGVPKKISKMYIGVKEETPIYSDGEIINIDNTNISEYFSITDGTYGFVWNDTDNAFSSNNGGVHNSTATSTWTALKDMKNITLKYSYSSENNYDKFTLTIAGKTIANAVSGATTIKSWSGDILAGQTIVLTYKKDSSANSNEDKCKIYDIKYDTRVLIRTEVKQLARNVKKAYIGVNGIAKKIFPPYKTLGHNTATPLSVGRCGLSATTVGNYALFAGGGLPQTTIGYYNIDAYDTKLTKSTPTSLSNGINGNSSATTVGNYALFAGGNAWGYATSYATVDAYDTKLTKSTPTPLSVAKDELASTTVGNYALFAGGSSYVKGSSDSFNNTVDAYDTSLTRTSATNLSQARDKLVATTVGNYALFAGGAYEPYMVNKTDTVDAYDTSLTRTIPTVLSVSRKYLSATTVGNYALFAGGDSGSSTIYSTVDAYDTSLTRTIPTPLSVGRYHLASTTVDNYALFAGGISSSDYSSTVDAYDTKLTRTISTPLSLGRCKLASTTLGNYALFAGGSYGGYNGNNNTGATSTVDVYQYD